MTLYGITPAGFVCKPRDVIVAELEADFRATFGAGIDLTEASPFGEIIGIFAEYLAGMWQLGEAVYTAGTADGSEGVPLVNVCALTGTTPNPPSKTRVVVVCTGNVGAPLAAGRVVSVIGAGSRFESTAQAQIIMVPAPLRATAYDTGRIVTADGRIYVARIGGVTSGSGASVPKGTAAGQTDGSVVWDFAGPGTGAVVVEFRAQATGPVAAHAGSLTTIETPVAGWQGAYNPEDHYYLGENSEPAAELRIRREQELRAQGNAALEAIRQSVLDVDDVRECVVFENPGDVVDADGRPPHVIEVLVDGGDDTAIGEAILASKPGGVGLFGTDVELLLYDSQEVEHLIKFNRSQPLPVYVVLDVVIDAAHFPADGAEQIRQLAVNYGLEHYRAGSDVLASPLSAIAFSVPGVVDCPPAKIGTAPNPATSNRIVTDLRQQPKLDSTRIAVNVT